jgi:alpha-tubulin suppressor-like RCC1 family protein
VFSPPDSIGVSSGQVQIGGQILSNVVAIAANRGYSMGLKGDGTVVAWGKMMLNLPVRVPAGLSNVVAIAAGENFSLAITTNRAVAERFHASVMPVSVRTIDTD